MCACVCAFVCGRQLAKKAINYCPYRDLILRAHTGVTIFRKRQARVVSKFCQSHEQELLSNTCLLRSSYNHCLFAFFVLQKLCAANRAYTCTHIVYTQTRTHTHTHTHVHAHTRTHSHAHAGFETNLLRNLMVRAPLGAPPGLLGALPLGAPMDASMGMPGPPLGNPFMADPGDGFERWVMCLH